RNARTDLVRRRLGDLVLGGLGCGLDAARAVVDRLDVTRLDLVIGRRSDRGRLRLRGQRPALDPDDVDRRRWRARHARPRRIEHHAGDRRMQRGRNGERNELASARAHALTKTGWTGRSHALSLPLIVAVVTRPLPARASSRPRANRCPAAPAATDGGSGADGEIDRWSLDALFVCSGPR